jgi:hypothetical protein
VVVELVKLEGKLNLNFPLESIISLWKIEVVINS